MKTGIHLECMNECYVFRSGFKKVGPIRVCPFTLNRGICGICTNAFKLLIWVFNLLIILNFYFIYYLIFYIFISPQFFLKYLVNVQDQKSKRQVTPMLVHPYLITSQSQTSPEQTI